MRAHRNICFVEIFLRPCRPRFLEGVQVFFATALFLVQAVCFLLGEALPLLPVAVHLLPVRGRIRLLPSHLLRLRLWLLLLLCLLQLLTRLLPNSLRLWLLLLLCLLQLLTRFLPNSLRLGRRRLRAPDTGAGPGAKAMASA